MIHSRGRDFAGLVDTSGHSTYRLIREGKNDEFDKYWSKLESLGCTYESGDYKGVRLYAVDVPRTADIYKVYEILELGQSENAWMFEEGHVGHKLR